MVLVSVPKNSTVFLIEDSPERIQWFEYKLGVERYAGYAFNPRTTLIQTKDPNEAIVILESTGVEEIDLFFFDHDLGGKPYEPPFSTNVAKYIVGQDPVVGKRVLIHSLNEPGRKNLLAIMPGAMELPFGTFNIRVTE